MEGAARAAKRKRDLAFWQAWHGVLFDRMKGRDLKRAWSDYFDGDKAGSPYAVLEYLRTLKAKGVPIEIRRLN